MSTTNSLQRAGRSLAPLLARIFLRRPFVKPLALLEAYLAFIQGKGSGGGWDMEAEARVASSFIHRPDAVVFDVGAHHGEWSRWLLRLLGTDSQCQVFQFEPLKYNLSVLHSLNLPRTTIVEAAVSDTPGTAVLYALDMQSPVALRDPLAAWSHVPSLHRRREAQLQRYDFVEEQVKVVTIDDTMESFGIDSVDFMKLDVEGSELAVLRGSRQALQTKRIKALTFEFGCGNINSRTYFHDFWDLLKGYGYTIQRICPGGILLEITEYYEDLEYFRGVTNYLATAQS
jgi:FkbM family methyltransferase